MSPEISNAESTIFLFKKYRMQNQQLCSFWENSKELQRLKNAIIRLLQKNVNNYCMKLFDFHIIMSIALNYNLNKTISLYILQT